MAAGDQRGDLVVVTGGINQAGQASRAVRLFDLKTKTWKPSLRMTEGRAMHVAVLLDDHHLLIAGGQSGQMKPFGNGLKPIASCDVIDLRTGKSKATPPSRLTMVHATSHALPNGQALIISGKHALVYDLQTNTWHQRIPLRAGRQSHASVNLTDNQFLIAGGVGQASIEVLDVKTGISTQLAAKLPDGVDDLAAVAMSSTEVWLIGGQYRGGWTTDRTWIVDLGDPQKATITDGPRLQIKDGIADACVAKVDHWIIVAGGESERNGNDTELSLARVINTKERKSYALPNMKNKHDDAFSVTTPRGIVIFGGYTQAFKLPVAVSAVEMFEIPKSKAN